MLGDVCIKRHMYHISDDYNVQMYCASNDLLGTMLA